jgi:endonuclease-3
VPAYLRQQADRASIWSNRRDHQGNRRDRFATWEDVRDAPVDLIEEAIRPGGISKVKSARIKDILVAIAPAGELSLAELTVPDAQARLTALPGVGRKTAACVLLFALGMRDVPVDTHVSRVGTRLGLFRPRAPFEEMHDEMLALTPRGAELELHLNLLRHGRRTCHARRPQCSACALARMCPSAHTFWTAFAARSRLRRGRGSSLRSPASRVAHAWRRLPTASVRGDDRLQVGLGDIADKLLKPRPERGESLLTAWCEFGQLLKCIGARAHGE